jgi:hypothetical protein
MRANPRRAKMKVTPEVPEIIRQADDQVMTVATMSAQQRLREAVNKRALAIVASEDAYTIAEPYGDHRHAAF